jgi:hypothetical protein
MDDREVDELIAVARLGPAATTAGVGVVIGGLFTAMIWPQLIVFDIRVWHPFMWLVPPFLSVLGVTTMALGGWTSAGRLWAAVVAMPVLLLSLLVELIWLVWTLSNYAFSLLFVFAIGGSMLAIVADVAGIVITARIRAAKQKALLD